MEGQVSVEFMMIMMLLLGAIAIITTVSFTKSNDIETLSLQREAGNTLSEISTKINTVYLEGNGFSSNITLPDRIRGFNYTITTQSNFVIITILDISYSKTILTNVSGTLVHGENKIRNVNGEVQVV